MSGCHFWESLNIVSQVKALNRREGTGQQYTMHKLQLRCTIEVWYHTIVPAVLSSSGVHCLLSLCTVCVCVCS